ncbi:MAG: hypothetical protein R2932_20430 [Caldilineaceae bacterium]
MPDRAKAIGLIVFGGTIAAVVGPFFVTPAGALMARFGWLTATGPYAASALLSLICLSLVFIFLRPDPLNVGRAIEDEYGAPHRTAALTTRRTLLRPCKIRGCAWPWPR